MTRPEGRTVTKICAVVPCKCFVRCGNCGRDKKDHCGCRVATTLGDVRELSMQISCDGCSGFVAFSPEAN